MKKPARKTSKPTSRSRRSSQQPKPGDGVEAALEAIAAAMKRLKATWYVFGAQAVALHGAQRTTQDVDVTVLTEAATDDVVRELKRQALTPFFDDAAFIAQTRVIPCRHDASGWKVDVVLGGPGFEELIAAEAITAKVGALSVPVLRVEHLLVLKMLAGRPQDFADVDRLLRARPEANRVEVVDLLRTLEAELVESGLVDRFEQLADAER